MTRDDLISFKFIFLETCLPQYTGMLHEQTIEEHEKVVDSDF